MGDESVSSISSALDSLSLASLQVSEHASPPPSLAGTSFGRDSATSYSSDGSSCSLGTPASFDPSQYLHLHRKAVGERLWKGTNRSNKMKFLFRYWTAFLPDNFNEGMYGSFVTMAQEDAAAEHEPSIYGLTYLFQFYTVILSATDTFDESLFNDFERIAHSTHDYMGLDLGVKCLVEYLAEHEPMVVEAGISLSPITIALLEIHRQHQKEDADPRERLHQRLAEKKSMRSKRRERRDRQSAAGQQLSKLGGDEASGSSPPTTSEAGDPPHASHDVTPLEPQAAGGLPRGVPTPIPKAQRVPRKPHTSRFTLFPRWKKRGQHQPPPAAQKPESTITPQEVTPSPQGGTKWTLPDSDSLGFGWS